MRNPITLLRERLSPPTRDGAAPSESPRSRRTVLAVGSVIAIAGIVATGFVTQNSIAEQARMAEEQAQRVAATELLSAGTGLQSDQLEVYSSVLDARAAHEAEAALNVATPVLEAAVGKTDASELSATVASLGDYTALPVEQTFALARQTHVAAATVQAGIVEADRVAAEKAAAEAAAKAAAKAAAAAAAAAEARKTAVAQVATNVTPGSAQAIARDMIASQYGWGADQFNCLVSLWNKESGWRVNAYNASSGATGIPQSLPGNKMASHGADWQTNPATQISWGLSYISARYGTACGAWNHSQSRGWY